MLRKVYLRIWQTLDVNWDLNLKDLNEEVEGVEKVTFLVERKKTLHFVP